MGKGIPSEYTSDEPKNKPFRIIVVETNGAARMGPDFEEKSSADSSAEYILQTDRKANEVHVVEFHSTFVKEFRAVKVR